MLASLARGLYGLLLQTTVSGILLHFSSGSVACPLPFKVMLVAFVTEFINNQRWLEVRIYREGKESVHIKETFQNITKLLKNS